MHDQNISFRSFTLLDQPRFPITFDQFMNAPLSTVQVLHETFFRFRVKEYA